MGVTLGNTRTSPLEYRISCFILVFLIFQNIKFSFSGQREKACSLFESSILLLESFEWTDFLSLEMERGHSLISVSCYYSSPLSQFSCFTSVISLHGDVRIFLHPTRSCWCLRGEEQNKDIMWTFRKELFLHVLLSERETNIISSSGDMTRKGMVDHKIWWGGGNQHCTGAT